VSPDRDYLPAASRLVIAPETAIGAPQTHSIVNAPPGPTDAAGTSKARPSLTDRSPDQRRSDPEILPG
jgi:hypothetical protein